jgi:hypothetical protein
MSVSYAQKPKVKNDPTHDDRPIHFGFSLGLNFMDYSVKYSQFAVQNGIYGDLPSLTPGINIHAIANLRLAEYFDLRMLPGISFGERRIDFIDRDRNKIYTFSDSYKAESSYLEFPLLIKYKSKRLNNFRPFLIGGGNVKVDLAVKKEYDERDQLFMILPLNYCVEIGAGMDFYLTYFKMSMEFKYSIGLRNIYTPTNRKGEGPEFYTEINDAIDGIYSNMFVISFHFE